MSKCVSFDCRDKFENFWVLELILKFAYIMSLLNYSFDDDTSRDHEAK